MKKNDIKIGDSVKVKNGVPCPDQKDLCIGGWQGRVSEITEDGDGNFLVSEYNAMYLRPDEVELTEARDKEDDGIIVELRRGHNKYDHPLCDMEVINSESSNYQPVNDYCTWYANH